MSDKIIIRGAREHNLKNISVEIPRDRLVVITGLSGSGKSSLAFDTLYAEGQRRYVESLSAYARQFLEQMEKPDVDTIEGLSPAISIQQKTTSRNPRSTVGTVTEIHDYLRLLFARAGRPHCYQCGKEIQSQTIQQIVDQIMALPPGSRLQLFSPIIRGRKGEYRKEFDHLRKSGYARVRVDGAIRDLGEEISLDKNKKHTLEVLVDRLVVKEGAARRLADSLATAMNLSEGIVKVEVAGGEELVFSEKFACVDCGISYPEISPRMFSFNNPYGACPQCDGLGTTNYFDPDLIVPDPDRSIREGAIIPWQGRTSMYFHAILQSLADHYQIDLYAPFKTLLPQQQKIILYGSDGEQIRFYHDRGEQRHFYYRDFEGVIPQLERRYRETDSEIIREEMEKYMNIRPCPVCQGARLRKESLFVKVGGLNIHEVTEKSIRQALDFFARLELNPRERDIARRILKEISERLGFLLNVGLDYLTLSRSSATLSGGESERIRLATQIGSGLVGVLYILDEPSIGLHQKDNARLLATLKRLRDLGNTILVVEHDEETIQAADYVLDLGPGAGVHGGELVFQGPPQELVRSEASLTGKYLSGKLRIPVPERRRNSRGRYLTLIGAGENNLKEITVRIPLGLLTCVTGVSGSGKSTLVIDTLYRALAQKIYRSKEKPGKVREIQGLMEIDKVIEIDQSPIGRTPRSNPATYTGVFTPIRDLFAQIPESRARGYHAGRYSFNVKGGRCEACGGDGIIKIEMHFLPDIYVTCDVCRGKRYNRETLEVRYKGQNIWDVLDMTVEQALKFFANIPPIRGKLETLADVGMGYIKLGQQATTLSGGEAQRVKLSRELSKRSTGKTVYILDEPTTGLHFDDIHKLLGVLNRLVESGNTVIVIEHNLEVIKTADHIIDLGPEGGEAGGQVIAEGTPEEVARNPRSYTGQFLKKILERDRPRDAV
ncbi:MAG: excinuclease ABC subunit A [Deltaproteobacteria bacterium SM23_61]|nr:MAG: excinuclease ABC subunit A [Deltaproteobacteria bacterium SM23_61]